MDQSIRDSGQGGLQAAKTGHAFLQNPPSGSVGGTMFAGGMTLRSHTVLKVPPPFDKRRHLFVPSIEIEIEAVRYGEATVAGYQSRLKTRRLRVH